MDRLGAWASNIVKLPTIRELRAQIKVYLPQDQSTHRVPPRHRTGLSKPRSSRGFFFALIPNALPQRLEIIFRQGHRYAWACWPSPEIANHTADETLAKAVDLDERSIAVGVGVGWELPTVSQRKAAADHPLCPTGLPNTSCIRHGFTD
jgi:hypothetical protein